MLQGVKNMMVSDIANVVVEYLATLPDGTTISTSDAIDRTLGCKFLSGGRCRIGDEIVDTMGFFDIDEAVRKTAGEKGIILNSAYCAGVPVGLPFNIPYTVTKADNIEKETPNSRLLNEHYQKQESFDFPDQFENNKKITYKGAINLWQHGPIILTTTSQETLRPFRRATTV